MLVLLVCSLLLSAIADVAQCAGYKRVSGGWIKKFTLKLTWEQAVERCQRDGAVLASPLDNELLREIQPTEYGPDCDGEIFTGIHALFHPDVFVSLEGVPIDEMAAKYCIQFEASNGRCIGMNRWGLLQRSCSNALAFACYKKRTQDMVLNDCGTYDPLYKLVAGTGNCYKVHINKRNWTEAYADCYDEGAHLAVLSANEVSQLNGYLSEISVKSNLLIGTRQLKAGGAWVNVHGTHLNDDYNNLNLTDESLTYVATLEADHGYRLGFVSDDEALPFICQKDPHDVKFPQEEQKKPQEKQTEIPQVDDDYP